ncbi:MAG: T9SS type A sorting domain-containing protein [Bacteroidetes bacterium]|nr:T9SS type A sorting domain-containing protein [Bacteroidota bacterium]
MKNILLSFLFSGAIYASAQTVTWDFDTPAWTGSGTGIEPSGWISENEITLLGNPQSVFQATSPDVHGGTYAMKLLSVTMTNNPGNSLPNPIGLAAPGKLVSFVPKFGMQYTARPASVSFWYKYAPAAGDTAQFLIALWNSTTHDTIASGFWPTGTTVTNYVNQTVTLIYNPAFSTEFPDSMGLTFSSTKLFNKVGNTYVMCMNCGMAGSTLWVDDISFNGWNGINEHTASNDITLFPNPATDIVTIIADVNEAYSVNAYDMTGRKISSAIFTQSMNAMNRKETHISTSKFPSGIYSYTVLDKNGNALCEGKFNVIK